MTKGIFLSLGGNLGDVKESFKKAIELLQEYGIKTVAKSSLYKTEPIGPKDQPWFLNQVIRVETELSPQELLKTALNIELDMGRQHIGDHWGPRNVDIDILFYNQDQIYSPLLRIPHKEIINRRFVLIPMKDIAPDFVHPEHNMTISDILEDLEQRDESMVELAD